MKRNKGHDQVSLMSNHISADRCFFVSAELAGILCQRFRHSLPAFLAIEEMVERMFPYFEDPSKSMSSLSELISGISMLPKPSETRSAYPVFLSTVDLAIHVGKCKPLFCFQRGLPWKDKMSFGIYRFSEADIIWVVEEIYPTQAGTNVWHSAQERRLPNYCLFVWVSVLGSVSDIAGVLEQSLLYSQPELYFYHRYGIAKPRGCSPGKEGDAMRRDGEHRLSGKKSFRQVELVGNIVAGDPQSEKR